MGSYNKNKHNVKASKPTAFIGEQDAPTVENWKRKYGNVYAIKTEKKDIFYVRSPKIQEIEAYQPLLQQSKFITYNIGLFKTCYLGGAPIPTDEATLSSIAGQMMKTVEVVVSEVEKL